MMKLNRQGLNTLLLAGVYLFLAVALGAMGAHALKTKISVKALETYQTGVTYQFYHAFGLLFVGSLQLNSLSPWVWNKVSYFFNAGIILFSFNCYLYAVSGIKTFALIVPLGGISFMLGWAIFVARIIALKRQQ